MKKRQVYKYIFKRFIQDYIWYVQQNAQVMESEDITSNFRLLEIYKKSENKIQK